MTTYITSVLIVAVSLTVAQLVLPKGRLKTAVEAAISVIFIAAMVIPFTDLDFNSLIEPETATVSTDLNLDGASVEMEKYCEKYFKERLKNIDLIAERVEVEISRGEIIKIDIYLSNLVIEENNAHININVIENYVAEKLSLNPEKISVHV